MHITRLAPSPTGALHLGNARTFVVNWILARRLGWRVLLRVEDLDGPRVKPGADRLAIEDLLWLGLDWDGQPLRQSTRLELYRETARMLVHRGLAYPCTCTRTEIAMAASAPHAEDGATVYPGTCVGKFATIDSARRAGGREPALRFHVPDGEIAFEDGVRGPRVFNPARELGDFVILKNDGVAAYQLAVVIDDAESGVDRVVRGDDLLDSTPRQILLYRALGLAGRIPAYWHLPLVVGTDGRRLAKRHGDTRLARYREAGVRPERLLGLLARWSGIEAQEITLDEFAERFDIDKLPRQRIVYTDQDDRWLRNQ